MVGNFLRRTLAPLCLIALCPPLVILFWYACSHLGGSLVELYALFRTLGFLKALWMIWGPVFFGSKTAWIMIFTFMASQLLLMRLVPGKRFLGPVTPQGNVPVYKANGPACFALTLLLFLFSSCVLKLFSPALIYDHFGEILGALCLFSLVFCLGLYLKGRLRPSSSDHGHTGNIIFDYYWGTELYPRIFGFDIKLFTNCRFGMMSWGLLLLSYAAKQYQINGFISDSMLVAIVLQLIYITKFFLWETGYLRSLDIMHDRAGFYICWGCLVWVPCIYTSPTLYLVNHPHQLGLFWSSAIGLIGAFAILMNYMADRQRQRVRALQGQCRVWGKKPVILTGRYTTAEGEDKESLLLASGFWGLSRHFHYLPEIIGAFCWSVPALFSHFLPYFYVLFLIILLVDRAKRDDLRCREKYGDDWSAYCDIVPSKIIPFIY